MATQYAKASYTEVVDLQTVNGKTSIIGLHTPVGRGPYDRLKGFFMQFRKYKYRGISSLLMVPAANLPVDPLGLTGVVGTTDLMDPRDNLNPILFHGAHGESLNRILDSIYSQKEYVDTSFKNTCDTAGVNVSDSTSEHFISNATADFNNAYYRCLTDVSWKKFGVQQGVKLRGLHPLVHKVAKNTPMVPYYSAYPTGNIGEVLQYAASSGTNIESPTNASAVSSDLARLTGLYGGWKSGSVEENTTGIGAAISAYDQIMTNGVERLGWLPTATRQVATSYTNQFVMLPKIYMGVLVMPPSYNIEQFFRMIIRHEFEFKEFTSSLNLMGLGRNDVTDDPTDANYFNWIDYGEAAKDEGITSVGDTIDMIDGESRLVSDGVS